MSQPVASDIVTSSLSLGAAAYHAGSYGSQELAGWHPTLQSPDAEVLPSRDKAVARARYLDRNNGYVHGAITKKADAIVGSNLRLRAKPDFTAMGMDAEWADRLSTKIEGLWRMWANDPGFYCDVERHTNFGGLVRLAYIHWALDGEACGVVYMLERGGPFETSVLVLDPDRLSNPDGKPDNEKLRGGVEIDVSTGAAIAYHVRKAHPADVGSEWKSAKWTRVPRERPPGRPLFVHAINKRRAHQHRSLGVLTPAMGRMRMLDTADRYELGAMLRNQSYGMYVESPFDSEFVRQALAPIGDGDESLGDLSAYQQLRLSFHEATDVSLQGVPLAHLAPGEAIKSVSATAPTTNYESFHTNQVGGVASPMGLATEQVTGRWAGVNYSNARMIVNEANRGWTSERYSFTQAFCTPLYAAWLEEVIALDYLEDELRPIGGKAMFKVWRAALTQAEWIGPPRGSIDKLKEGKGDQIDRDGMVATMEQHCAERGFDWRDVLYQIKREREEMRRFGLLEGQPATGGGGEPGGGAPDPDREADNDEADRREMAGEDE